MKLLIAAVGTRMPAWVETAFDEYAKRMPRELPLALCPVKAEPRSVGKTVSTMLHAEAQRLSSALPARCRMIALDEKGSEITTQSLAKRLQRWMQEGGDTAFLIGGADGLDPSLKLKADEQLRVSGLTLPHAMVRVLLAEALYRASSVIRGHPYHRE